MALSTSNGRITRTSIHADILELRGLIQRFTYIQCKRTQSITVGDGKQERRQGECDSVYSWIRALVEDEGGLFSTTRDCFLELLSSLNSSMFKFPLLFFRTLVSIGCEIVIEMEERGRDTGE